MARIFISYRRDDTEMVAGRLAKDLRAYFGEETVFRDKESIPVGADWAQEINSAIGPGGVVLVLIGEDWLEGKPKGQRRLDDAQDPHRNEIGAALQLGVPVLPLLVRNMKMPPPEELPAALQRLPALNAMKLRDDEWEGFDFPRLAKVLEKAGFKPKAATGSAESAEQRPTGRKPTSAKAIWAIVLALLGMGASSSPSDAGFGLFVALMAGLLAFFGFRDARAGRVKGERVAIAGMVASGVATLLALLAFGRQPAPSPSDPAADAAMREAVRAALAPVLTPTAQQNGAAPVTVAASNAPSTAAVVAQPPQTPTSESGGRATVANLESQQPAAPAQRKIVSNPGATQQPGEPDLHVNISGTWVDASDGTRVSMQQIGDTIEASVVAANGGVMHGAGEISGRQVDMRWGSEEVTIMTSKLKLSANGNELRGPTTFVATGVGDTTVLRREAAAE